MIKRIIFDIDGTLITGVDFSSYVANTLKKYGIEDIEKTKQFLLNIKEYEKTYNSYDSFCNCIHQPMLCFGAPRNAIFSGSSGIV